jgi:hypothetical protein
MKGGIRIEAGLQVVIRDARTEMVDMVDADIPGEPL